MERHHFEEELQTLKNRLLTMGALVEERAHQAIKALVNRSQESAEQIIASDKEVIAPLIAEDAAAFRAESGTEPRECPES